MTSKLKAVSPGASAAGPVFSHILVPVDGSRFSLKAVKTAARLAQSFDAQMTIFYCAPDFLGHYATESPELRDHYSSRKFRDAVARHSERILDEAARQAGIAVGRHSDLGTTPHTGIRHAAKKLHCDLIVMASRAKSGRFGIVPASETQNLLTHTKLPVLVVH